MASISDKDMFLTSEETKLLEESYQHEQEGKLISNKELRKELVFYPDSIMTTEEKRIFEQGVGELKIGKTTPLSKLKEELGI